MMMGRRLAVAAMIVAAAFGSLRAQRPALLKEIPLYPGAGQPPANQELPSPELGITLDTSRLYVVQAPIEAVVQFYQQRLSARQVSAAEFEQALERVDADAVAAIFTVSPHDLRSPALAPIKDAVTARAPYRPGQWLAWARFVWSRRETTGSVTAFGVSMVDGYDLRRPRDQGTVLAIAAGVAGKGAEGGEAAGAPGEPGERAPVAAPQAPAIPLLEPSLAELGVPRYPGAQFDGAISATLSSGGDRYYVYTAADLPEKVAAFFERETGKKPLRSEAGWLFAVRGSGLFPELGVTVQANAGEYPAPVKSVITVRRGGK